MNGLVMINGQICRADEASIPVFDRNFLYGDGIYEIIAAVNQRLIDIHAHLARLRHSAAQVSIPIPWTDEFLLFELEHLLELSKVPFASVRLLISRGVGGTLIPSHDLQTMRYIYCTEVKGPPAQIEDAAVKLKLCRSEGHHRGPQVKATHYLPAISEGLKARAENFDDILWMTPEGEFTEAGSANIFFIAREGDLVEIATPPVAAGILEGITRNRTIELLTRSGIRVTERTITVEELPRFDEAFLSSSIKGLRPVIQIEKHRLHSTRPQAVFRHIARLYGSWLKSEEVDAAPQPRHSS